MKINVKKMAQLALVTAVICILGPLSLPIPISPVPISLCILGIYLGAYVLGSIYGTIACALYILMGLVGLPVFSGFSGGPGKLFGPTGGYIIGYLFVALFSGLFIEKFEKKYYLHIVGMVIGCAICYVLGTLWLAHQANLSFYAALNAGVIPFIPADIVKMIIAILVGPAIRTGVKKLNS